ncbi:hypothetical protein, partial [Planktothrix agardhii]
MLRRIIQFFKRLIQRLFGKQPTPPSPSVETTPTRTDTEYEALFLQLLETLQPASSRGQIKGWLIGNRVQEAELVAWLERFGTRLQETPSQHEELARRLVFLASLDIGDLGDVAGSIGRSILAQITPQTEVTTSDINEVKPIIDADFIEDGLRVATPVNPSNNIEVSPIINAEFIGGGITNSTAAETPIIQETPVSYQPDIIAEETPIVEETPVNYQPEIIPEETPIIQETPVSYQPDIIAEETPIVEETPVNYQPEIIPEETPIVEETPVSYQPEIIPEETPIIQETPISYQPEIIPEETPIIQETAVNYQPEIIVEETP